MKKSSLRISVGSSALFSMCMIGSLMANEVFSAPFPQEPAQKITPEEKANQKMQSALEKTADFQFDELPWGEIEKMLEAKYKVSFVLDQSAKNDCLSDDEPITINLEKIRLKNALYFMLRAKNATFLIKNGAITIYSLDEVERIKPDIVETKESKKKRLERVAADNDLVAAKLKGKITLKYDETRWSEVEVDLEKRLGVNIYLERSAIDDSLTKAQPVTVNVTAAAGDALRTTLKMNNATYVVKNQVVTVISLDDLPPENNDQ
jgi:hypothetical protein